MRTENIEFQSDDNTLHGKIGLVDKSAPVVVFIPGISGEALSDRFQYLEQVFNQTGYNFLRFNFIGYENNHSVDDSTLREELTDLRNALTYLEAQGYNLARFGIVSKSFGNLKTILLNDPRLACVGMLAPALYFGNIPTVESLKDTKYGDIEHISDIVLSEDLLRNWQAPTIIIHGDQDKIVDLNNSIHILELLSSKKDLKVIPGAGHSLDITEDDRRVVTDYLIKFFKENFPS